jgi:hypothetical protein
MFPEGTDSGLAEAQQAAEAAGIDTTPKSPVDNQPTTPSGAPKSGAGKSSAAGGSGKAVMSDLEKSLEQDKWLSLAKFGLALMSSKQPTFGQAMGEAGIAAIGDLQAAKKNYEESRLARETLAARKAGSSKSSTLTPSNLISLRSDLASELADIVPDLGGTLSPAQLEQAALLRNQLAGLDKALGISGLGGVSSDTGSYKLSSLK